jgi:phosphoribosylamine--glycine ligase
VRVLLVGGGGREHALAWKLAQSPQLEALYAAPGNPGIARHARCVPIAVAAQAELVAFAERERIDFTLVGPEAPLVAGLADRFAERGLLALGPSGPAARLEGSKAFAKALMARYGIPTGRFETFDDREAAMGYAKAQGGPLVVKADGLAAGKGVIVCPTVDEALAATGQLMGGAFGSAGRRIVIEEFLEGEEVSFFGLSNGSEVVALGAAQDHKTVFDGDRGPNTGGMGAYSPVSRFAAAERQVMESIVAPTITALAKEGTPYRGVLFCGLMLTRSGPRVLEYNCRFGDPECQVLMARLDEDLLPLLYAAARGEPFPEPVALRPDAAVCVVVASGGYPGEHRTGLTIHGLADAERLEHVQVFQAGTVERDGTLVSAGGRVLGVTARGVELRGARDRAYDAITKIHFQGMHYRRDIGHRALATP